MRQVDGTEALARVRQMRRAPTDAERSLWTALRGRRLAGLKFRRQVWIDHYIADFLCQEARLIIELDGSHHCDRLDHDARRTAELERAGYGTLRFWNNEVTGELDRVLEAIWAAALARMPSPSRRCTTGPSLSPMGEGY